MAEIYKHEYEPISVYGNIVALMRERTSGSGVHVDLGCGYGAIAEPLRDECGLDYIGFDLAGDGLASLRDRGFEVATVDLGDPAEAERTIRSTVGGRRIASLSMINTLEHLANGPEVVALLRRLANETNAPLILSVPNVAHKDLAIKLLVGRWDITEAGLLDHTHVAFYTDANLRRMMASQGWRETAVRDWLLEHSDQEFPADLPVLQVATPLGQLLRSVIDRSNPHAIVNEFVRAYEPVEPRADRLFIERSDDERPFLSIVVSAETGSASVPVDLLQCLARQTDTNFEIVIASFATKNVARDSGRALSDGPDVLQDRLRVVVSSSEIATDRLNAALVETRGRFLTILDADDRPAANYIEAFADLAANSRAAVLQVARDALPDDVSGEDAGQSLTGLTLLDETVYRSSSVGHFAVPGRAIRDLGIRVVPEFGPWGAQELVAQAILFCGLARTTVVVLAAPSEPELKPPELAALSLRRLERLSANPLLLPTGEAANLLQSLNEKNWFKRQHVELALGLEQSEHQRDAAHRRANFPSVAAFLNAIADRTGPRATAALAASDKRRPFLSIITRTQGTRTATLRDMLLSLAGQTCQDFELILVVHTASPNLLAATRALVLEFPEALRSKIKVATCERAGRAAPLNDGVALASGDYFSVLDDDDFVFSHYVDTFRMLSEGSPNSLVRAACVRQNFVLDRSSPDEPRPRATSWFVNEWPSEYSLVDHLHANYTPFMAIAFPAVAVRDLGLRFDEGLNTTEDWAFTTWAAMLFGVVSSSEVTSVYRWWVNSESSLFVHGQEEWTANRQAVIDRLDSGPILLPKGSAAQICTLIEQKHELGRVRAYAEQLEQDLATIRARTEALTGHLVSADLPVFELTGSPAIQNAARLRASALLDSTSWRVTRPMRIMKKRITKNATPELMSSDLTDDLQLNMSIINNIKSSSSWRIMAPVRKVVSMLS